MPVLTDHCSADLRRVELDPHIPCTPPAMPVSAYRRVAGARA